MHEDEIDLGVEVEELFILECWETGKVIKHKGKKLFTKEEARCVFNALTDEQKESFRLKQVCD